MSENDKSPTEKPCHSQEITEKGTNQEPEGNNSPDLETSLDDCLDLYFSPITPKGVPEGYDYFEDYQDWYEKLQEVPAGDAFDDKVLTEKELRQRWECNSETLVRLLERFDIRIEHRKIRNRVGTYKELKRVYCGPDFIFDFFDLAEDALFRGRDILIFEETHPEVMMALKCREMVEMQSSSEQDMDPSVSPNGESSRLPTIESSGLESTSPDVPILMTEIEEYAKDHFPAS